MGINNFFKSIFKSEPKIETESRKEKVSIDLTDFKFVSDDHNRIENGIKSTRNNKGAYRGIRVQDKGNNVFNVTIYNLSGNHPVWGDNIQMAPKQMKIIEDTDTRILLKGFGVDALGTSFSNYGLSLHKNNGMVTNVTLHIYDRNVEIYYIKELKGSLIQSELESSEFDEFKISCQNWNSNLAQFQKINIALNTDRLNNLGCDAADMGDYKLAYHYWKEALEIMPNNGDALQNLRFYYQRIGDRDKVELTERKLGYLAQNPNRY